MSTEYERIRKDNRLLVIYKDEDGLNPREYDGNAATILTIRN